MINHFKSKALIFSVNGKWANLRLDTFAVFLDHYLMSFAT